MSVNEMSHRSADTAESPRGAPVIVMACTGSGADRLRSALSAFPELTCTAGTGIVPLCHHAVTTWQAVDGRAGGGLSRLGVASVRALGAGLVTAVLSVNGGKRWCELSFAPPAATESFARIYPQARFLSVHCRADTVVRAIIGASPWGLAGPEFAPFVSASPGSSVAALAGYWAAHTTAQLDFEQAHRQSCLGVRIEDFSANAAQALLDIGDFLSLAEGSPDSGQAFPYLDAGQALATSDDGGSPPVGFSPSQAGIPLAQIPPPLLAQLNELHRRLSYSPVTAGGA